MRDSLSKRLSLFIENINLVKKKYKFEVDIMRALLSFMYTKENKIIDYNKIDKAKDIIVENTYGLSDFRSRNLLMGATKISLNEDPRELFLNSKKARDVFKKVFKFSSSSAQISYFLGENKEKYDVKDVVQRGREIYDIHKLNHPFLTGDEDILISMLLGIYKTNIKESIEESEYYYNKLKYDLKYREDVQRISNILVLFDLDKDNIIKRIIDLNTSFKESFYKLSRNTLFILPLLVILEEDNLKIKKELIEVYEDLEKNKVVGVFKIPKMYGLMFAGVVLILDYLNNKEVSNDVESIVINEVINIENLIEDVVLMNTLIVTNTIIINNNR